MNRNIIPFIILLLFGYMAYKLYNDVFKVEFNLIKLIAMVLIIIGACMYGYSVLRKLNSRNK